MVRGHPASVALRWLGYAWVTVAGYYVIALVTCVGTPDCHPRAAEAATYGGQGIVAAIGCTALFGAARLLRPGPDLSGVEAIMRRRITITAVALVMWTVILFLPGGPLGPEVY